MAAKLQIEPHLVEQEIRPRVLANFLPANAASNYAVAIDALAAHDPGFAFEISGHGRLPEILNLQQFVASSVAPAADSGAAEKSLLRFCSKLTETIAQDSIATLEDAMLTMAKASARKLERELRVRFAQERDGMSLNSPEMQQCLVQMDQWISEMLALASSTETSDEVHSGQATGTCSWRTSCSPRPPD